MAKADVALCRTLMSPATAADSATDVDNNYADVDFKEWQRIPFIDWAAVVYVIINKWQRFFPRFCFQLIACVMEEARNKQQTSSF